MTDYYVTWDEKKYGGYFMYARIVSGNNIPHVRKILREEQDYRKLYGLPHMFLSHISKSRPSEEDLQKRKRGTLYLLDVKEER